MGFRVSATSFTCCREFTTDNLNSSPRRTPEAHVLRPLSESAIHDTFLYRPKWPNIFPLCRESPMFSNSDDDGRMTTSSYHFVIRFAALNPLFSSAASRFRQASQPASPSRDLIFSFKSFKRALEIWTLDVDASAYNISPLISFFRRSYSCISILGIFFRFFIISGDNQEERLLDLTDPSALVYICGCAPTFNVLIPYCNFHPSGYFSLPAPTHTLITYPRIISSVQLYGLLGVARGGRL